MKEKKYSNPSDLTVVDFDQGLFESVVGNFLVVETTAVLLR